MTGSISGIAREKVMLKFVAGKNSDFREGQVVEFTFVTDSKTSLTLDGKAARLSDLKEGQKAVVTYITDKDGTTMTAVEIKATSAR